MQAFRLIITLVFLSWLGFTQAKEPVITETESEEILSEQISEEQKAYYQQILKQWQSMQKQTGLIELANGVASLNVPDDFYYLNPEDAQTVLTDFWGNPPSEPSLGMLFAAGSSPLDSGSWGVTIEFTEEGYVSDKDADEIDYNDLLETMQNETREASEYRKSQGYESIELMGWAAKPFYDKNSHKMHWAKEIRFGDQEVNTLNYNIRVLGRKGVLVLNFIAGMDQLDIINSKLDSVLAMADFKTGSTYADFDPSMDEVAAYGIGALVAGKVIAKTGLLVGLMLILKKFGIFIVLGLGALFKSFFSRKKQS